ncbi:YhfC family intramembrane metalloprotease [Scopulibacillus cellulosilyticus]|uniref:YhfC family intramembrane metalloprotease n=1 Tax=Scopulibacillus cellulosilyticus TaxID=2665665 RepID=A0ABW2PXY8_9BACL
MVSQLSMTFMVLTLLISLAIPIVFFIYFFKKYRISWKPLLVGILIFIVFSQVLEKTLHMYILKINHNTAELLKNPYLYALYGGLTAGIFEEIGRFVGFHYLLKKYREWKDGISYGIGHGGIEAILVGVFSSVQTIFISNLINSGSFNQLLNVQGAAKTSLLTLKEQLIDTSSYLYLMGGFERIFSFLIQLGLSILVLYTIRKRRTLFLIYAILIHAFIDFIAALSNALKFNAIIPEMFFFVMAVFSIIFIRKSKELFARIETSEDNLEELR